MLELREKIKKRKPTFVVKESKFSARVKSRWRFPRGKHSKVRQMHKGRPKLVSTGYGSPKSVKHLHSSGLEKVMVKNKQELLALDTSKQGAIVSSQVGNRKKLEILHSAVENKIEILNLKDVNKCIEKIDADFEARKKIKQQKQKSKSEKEVVKKKKAEEKKKKEQEEKQTETVPEKGSNVEETKEEKIKEEKEKQKEDIEKTIIKKQ